MDTDHYDNDSLESSDEEEDEDEDEYYGYYGRYEHEYKECKRCTTDANYEYVNAMRPVVFTEVPKLTEITSMRIAISIWNHVNVSRTVSRISRKCTKKSDKWTELCNEMKELINELEVPNIIAKSIKIRIVKMQIVLTKWVSYHFRTVFLKKAQDNQLYSLFHHIVWYPNCFIDCKQTARNMLLSPRLSDVEKFKFLATYCLKDEMEQMSSLVFMNTFLEFVNFSDYPLIYYWYCCFKNEPHKIPVPENVSVYQYMFRHDKVDNWTAKEYFFDHLHDDEQAEEAIWLIDKHGLLYQKLVLMKLNEIQRLLVFTERPVQILALYAKYSVYSKDLLFTWFKIRNLISADTFVKIFSELLKVYTVDVILTVIWASATDHFKSHLLDYNQHQIVNQLLLSWKWVSQSEFIFIVLRDADKSTRKSIVKMEFFAKYCQIILADSEKFSRFERLLNLCMPRVEESMVFKHGLANSETIQNLCLKYYSSGNIKNSNDLLTLLFSSDTNLIQEYKKNLIMSPNGIEMCIKLLDLVTDVLNEVINDASFPPNRAIAFKTNLAYTPSVFRKCHKWILEGKLSCVQNCVIQCFESNEDIITYKKKLISEPEKWMNSIFAKHGESYWQTLLLWCYGDEDSVQEFKRSLHVDSLFIEMLKNSVFDVYHSMLTYCKFKYRSNFDLLDRFLNWYFESPSEVMKYKMRKIDKPYNIEMINTLLKKKDESYLKDVMKWFFQNDVNEIAKFKAKHGCRSKLCNMI